MVGYSLQEEPPVCAGEPVITAKRVHPFPSRTRKLSSSAPTILCGQLHGKIGHRRLTRSSQVAFVFVWKRKNAYVVLIWKIFQISTTYAFFRFQTNIGCIDGLAS